MIDMLPFKGSMPIIMQFYALVPLVDKIVVAFSFLRTDNSEKYFFVAQLKPFLNSTCLGSVMGGSTTVLSIHCSVIFHNSLSNRFSTGFSHKSEKVSRLEEKQYVSN